MNRKEKTLRQEIRRIVRATLAEGDYSKKKEDTNEQDLGRATSTTSGRIDRLVDTQYMRALQKSLQVGSPSQKASAVLMIVQKLIGNDSQAVEKLKRELQSKSVRSAVIEPPAADAVTEDKKLSSSDQKVINQINKAIKDERPIATLGFKATQFYMQNKDIFTKDKKPSKKLVPFSGSVSKLSSSEQKIVNRINKAIKQKKPIAALGFMPTQFYMQNKDMFTETELKGTLAGKKERMEKTQAFKMLTRALQGKPSTQQVDFVFAMLDSLPLDQTAKNRLRMKFRSEFK
jgi:hypothetical protein